MKIEAELAHAIKRLCPAMERIENSVKTGNPDCLMPGWLSWDMVELKMIHHEVMHFQKTQLAYFVKASRLQKKYWPMVLGCRTSDNLCVMFTLPDILNADRRALARKYIELRVNIHIVPKPLKEVLENFGYLTESNSTNDKKALYNEENA